MNTIINEFIGDYRFLSNFYFAPIIYEGIRYISTEVAYQAAKTLDTNTRIEMSNLKSSEAKRIGKTIPLRSDWETVKESIMYELCYKKFTEHKDLQKKLLDTGEAELIEGNWWGDTYWGVCRGIGENKLGKILMKIRNQIRNEQSEDK